MLGHSAATPCRVWHWCRRHGRAAGLYANFMARMLDKRAQLPADVIMAIRRRAKITRAPCGEKVQMHGGTCRWTGAGVRCPDYSGSYIDGRNAKPSVWLLHPAQIIDDVLGCFSDTVQRCRCDDAGRLIRPVAAASAIGT